MNATMMEIFSIEGVKLLNEECFICFNKFINISYNNLLNLYENLIKENKYIITEDYIEWRALCYDDRRVCLRCENNFCYDCFMKMYASKNSREYDNIEATNKNYFRPICRNPICGRLNIKGRLKICYCDEEDTLFLPENLFYDNITKYTKYKNV
jgi:hypothetical protein